MAFEVSELNRKKRSLSFNFSMSNISCLQNYYSVFTQLALPVQMSIIFIAPLLVQ